MYFKFGISAKLKQPTGLTGKRQLAQIQDLPKRGTEVGM